MTDDSPTVRRRMPYWIGIGALILLFPAIVIPLLVRSSRELAFTSIDDIEPGRVRSLALLIIERPDGGPNIGAPSALHQVPPADFDSVLALLRNSPRATAESPRGVWLGRLVVTLTDGRTQTVMLHRPKSDSGPPANRRLELRIGTFQFDGPPVDEFLDRIGKLTGHPVPPKE
jgi:hypothetical protein